MGLRAVQPAFFGLAALAFLLPFSHVSCAGGPESFRGDDPAVDDHDAAELRGYELLIGGDVYEHFPGVGEGFALPDQDVRFGAEPFAVLALAAAVGGAGVSMIGPARSRAIAGVVAGAVGALSLVVLGLAPTLGSFGVAYVRWQAGYWTCLALFAAATGVSWLEYRRVPRPPPRPSS